MASLDPSTTILITGSRNFNQDAGPYFDYLIQTIPFMFEGKTIEVIHGGAKGADIKFGLEAQTRGWKVKKFEAQWESYGKAAGVIRNSEMVACEPDLAIVVLAQDSKGTRDCYSKLLKSPARLQYILLVTENDVTLNHISKLITSDFQTS